MASKCVPNYRGLPFEMPYKEVITKIFLVFSKVQAFSSGKCIEFEQFESQKRETVGVMNPNCPTT